ncbi:MAG: hypothetical protein ABSH20_15760 [Tepidisphaeraceae bacterium]
MVVWSTIPSCLVAGLLMLMAWTIPAYADVVESMQGRFFGRIVFGEKSVRVQDRTVAWNDLVFVLRQEASPSVAAPQTLYMSSGEIWHVNLQRLTGKKLKVISPLLGERDVDLASVRMVDLVPDAGGRAGNTPGTLYREGAEPVPCTLMWINADRVSADSTLGILTLPREGSLRYVNVAAPTTLPAGHDDDEVGLIDGSTFRGRATLGADRIELQHATVGKLTIPAAAVRSLVRSTPAVTFITGFARGQMQTIGVTGPSALPALAAAEPAGCLHQITLQPRTIVRYPLSQPGATLRLAQQSVAGTRGDALIRVRAGEKVLLEQKVTPADGPGVATLDLGAAKELTIEVDFASAPRFPCGVAWLDPVLIRKQEPMFRSR